MKAFNELPKEYQERINDAANMDQDSWYANHSVGDYFEYYGYAEAYGLTMELKPAAAAKSIVVKYGKGKKQFAPCGSFAEAAKIVLAFTEGNDLGFSDWYGKTEAGSKDVGCIFDAEGKFLARVSYNGKIWENRDLASVPRKEISAEVAATPFYLN